MFVKICANTNLADAQLAAELGADAVGFVFAPSKRRVSVEEVGAITARLPSSVATVGVFAMQDAEEIVSAVRGCGLTGVQLHSKANPALVAELNCAFEGRVQLIQLVPYAIDAADRDAADAQFEMALRAALSMPAISAVLLDAAREGKSGGLGAVFDWSHAAELVRRGYEAAAGRDLPKLIVAGGLRAENVGEAIAALRPWGVDVASGVESEPGKKDAERLRAFLSAARTRAA
ncbi:MAG TPA: phosphoribosylanthranilate isomerase [Acidobacteriaceae bacterium]|jgi:phosphoribosylanthranilate isomerase|nr:phosphoribosylanthranilate isomerase [Acidobacteriaceae bacterium]